MMGVCTAEVVKPLQIRAYLAGLVKKFHGLKKVMGKH